MNLMYSNVCGIYFFTVNRHETKKSLDAEMLEKLCSKNSDSSPQLKMSYYDDSWVCFESLFNMKYFPMSYISSTQEKHDNLLKYVVVCVFGMNLGFNIISSLHADSISHKLQKPFLKCVYAQSIEQRYEEMVNINISFCFKGCSLCV